MSLSRQIPLPFTTSPSLGDSDFLITEANREAVVWIERWPDWPTPALVIYGPKGCGKTHLTHIFHGRTAGCLIDERQLSHCSPDTLLENNPAAIIDDADEIVGKGFQEHVLHLYNLAREHGRQMLLTACAPPGSWPISLPDLSSRLNSCPAIGIKAPDDAMMAALLVKLFHDRQITVDADVVNFAVSRMERSFDAARKLVATIDRVSQSAKRKVSVPLVRAVLSRPAEPADESG